MSVEVYLDPSDERTPIERGLARRTTSLKDAVVGLVDISKPKGDRFLDIVERVLEEKYAPRQILRYRKPTFAKPAPEDLRRKISSECGLIIEALAD